jgi:hypothetical protein
VLTTGNVFDVLGAPLAVGARWPESADRQREVRVILTDRVWRSAFAGRGDVVGRTIALDHAPGYEIQGVARAGFDFPRGIEVYRSIGGFTDYEKRERRNVVGIARVKRPHTVARLQAELDSVGRRRPRGDAAWHLERRLPEPGRFDVHPVRCRPGGFGAPGLARVARRPGRGAAPGVSEERGGTAFRPVGHP